MGDLLRRLLYPLLLPAIVATVWLHAWAMRSEPGHIRRVPAAAAAEAGMGTFAPPTATRGYGFAETDHAFAGLDFEDQ